MKSPWVVISCTEFPPPDDAHVLNLNAESEFIFLEHGKPTYNPYHDIH